MTPIAHGRGLSWAATAVMVGLLLASAIAIWTLRQGAIADTEEDNHRLGVVLSEQTARTFQAVDLVLQEIVDQIARTGVHTHDQLHVMFGGIDVHEALARRLVNLPQAEAFTIDDADGNLVNGSRDWPVPDYSLAYQSYFRHLAETPGDAPYVSEPGISHSSGARTVFLARRLSAANGTFVGVVVAPIRLDYFETFLTNTGLSNGSGVTILGKDGVALVRYPAADVARDMHVLNNPTWREAVAAGGGHYRSLGVFSNAEPVFVSVHPLTLYPIVVDITRLEDAALARWRRQAIGIGLSALVATASLALLLVAFRRQIGLLTDSQRRIGEQIARIQQDESNLAAQSALLNTTLNHMSQGLVVVDADGIIAVSNPRATELLDLPTELVSARSRFVDVLEFLKDRGEFSATLSVAPIAWSARLDNRAAYEHHRPDGTALEVCSVPLPNGGMVRTYTDVTERKQLIEALRQSQERLALATESARIGIWDWDVEADKLVWDSRMYELYGLREQDFSGAYDAWQAGLHPEDRAAGDAAINAAIDGVRDFNIEFRVVWPDGQVRDIEAHALVRRSANGGGVRMVGVNIDITDRKRLARAKGDFLAMISHEIRSPMSGLLGIVELLNGTALDHEQREMVALLRDSGAALLGVLNDVLDFSKMDAGKVELNFEPTDLRAFTSALIAAQEPGARRKGLSLTCDVAEELPAWISTDPQRLRQILVNLLANAIKFTAKGSVRLRVAGLASARNDGDLTFAISDTGIGISPDIIGHLFEPFTQADGSTTRTFGGTGLGLTISRQLARLFGGDIEAVSDPGHGSVFTLRIPLARAANTPVSPPRDAPEQDHAPLAIDVLVAEDHIINRWLIARQLGRLGCSVTTVEDGGAALARLDTNEYGLLITDCHMPEMDGVTLTRLIRASEATHARPRMRILGLTADVTTEMRGRCLAAGMDGVVTKPIDLGRLRAALAGLADPGGDADSAPGEHTAAAVFDAAAYRELFDDEDAEGPEWLNLFLESVAELLSAIEDDVAGEDRDALAANAHKLAGASLAAGAICLGLLARRLETAARGAAASELHAIAGQVFAAWRDAKQAVGRFVADLEVAG